MPGPDLEKGIQTGNKIKFRAPDRIGGVLLIVSTVYDVPPRLISMSDGSKTHCPISRCVPFPFVES